VLGVWCKSYTDLVTSTMTIALLGHSSELRKRMNEVDANNAEVKLTDTEKASVRKDLRSLVSYADARQLEYASCNTTALGFLTQVIPVVRNRGLFFMLNGGEVYAGTGQQVIKQDQWNHFFGYTRRMSVTIAKEDVVAGKLNPLYHFWNLTAPHYRPSPPGTIDDVYHARLESQKLAKPSGSAVTGATVIRGNASEFSDIWSIPNPQDAKGSYIYCSDGEGQPPGLQLYKVDENNKLERVNWWPPTKAPLLQVRVITPPTQTLPDDPDKDAMPQQLLAGVDHDSSIIYGTLRSSSDIYVDRSNERCYVPAPWQTYTGIAADAYFLWVFGPTGFTCATHASVMRSIQSKSATPPRWLRAPSLDSLLYDGDQYRGNMDEREGRIPPHPGLIDFCPCEDGTLFICLTTRKIIKETVPHDRNYFRQEDRNALYTAVYRIDLKSQTIDIGPWTRFSGGAGATQIQKLPVPSWKFFNSLKADLSAKASTATA
jgi:hypothetical protein